MTSLNFSLTSLDFEGLVKTSEVPEPIPLQTDQSIPVNPMLFNHDWGVECELRTSWQTDITQSSDQHEDRWILSNRPNRALSFRVVGASKAESDAILQSAIQSAKQFGFPVPIYPDGVQLTGGDGLVGQGDFSHRRFFRGGRVAILNPKTDPLQSNQSASFASIFSVSSTEIQLSDDQGHTIELSGGEVVYPCMDVELVEESSGTALTDGVYETELEWVEVDGSSSLPASWPVDLPNAPSNLAPLCEVIDGYGLFPFNPNWSEGVEIKTRRLVDSNRMGRTSVQTPTGDPFYEFKVSVMGYDRPSCWRVARFFDAHRGRGRSFWFEHPMTPWSLASSPLITTTSVRLEGRGSASSFESAYRQCIITMQDGTRLIRTIDSVQEITSGDMEISWTEALPNEDVLSVQPVFMCRFDQDSLQENWNTDEAIPSMELKIAQEPKAAADVSVGDLGFDSGLNKISSLGDNSFIFNAGSEGYDYRDRPHLPYPASYRPLRVWRDSGVKYGKRGTPAQNRHRIDTNARLVLPNSPFIHGGQPILFPATTSAVFDNTFMLDSDQPINDRQLWDVERGWTIAICISRFVKQAAFGSRRLLIDIFSTGEYGVSLTIDDDGLISGYEQFLEAGPVGSIQTVPISTTPDGQFFSPIYILRFGGTNEGNSVRLWINGEPATSSGVSIPLEDVSDYSQARFFGAFPVWTLSRAGISTAINTGLPGASMLASFKEALSLENINSLGDILSAKYQTTYTQATLY